MNEAVFLAALLHIKGVITYKEALALREMSKKETFSDSLADMTLKIKNAFEEHKDDNTLRVTEIDARDLGKKVLQNK